MIESVAFGVIVAGLAVIPPAAALVSRRSKPAAAVVVTLAFAGVFLQIACSHWPHLIAPWLEGTDLALFFPAWLCVPATTLLAALVVWVDGRNRRAVAIFTVMLGLYGVWEASWLVRDPATALGNGGHWNGDCYMQSTSWSCAPSASVSLLRTLGIDATEAEMARLMQSRARYGSNPLNMHRALARKLEGTRWRAETRSLDYDALVAAKAPGIAAMRLELLLDHAVAVLAAEPDGITVLDPLVGHKRMSRAEFEAGWLRSVILVRQVAP